MQARPKVGYRTRVIATRNLGDFRRAGIALADSFDPVTWSDDLDDDPVSALSRTW
jgi:hypothetical protein